MSSNDVWQASTPDQSREFICSVDLYISPLAAHSLRKPPNPRKNRRDSGKSTLDDGRKIKEKPSWMSLTRTSASASAGHFRRATCKLSESDGKIMLYIYVDETILYQTLYVNMLSHTEIRQVDPSLLGKKDSLGLHPTSPHQRWTSAPTNEPVYIQYSSAETCKAWLVLLRSYASPEIYDGGYRMYRQLDLTVIQGRNIGTTRNKADAASHAVTSPEDAEEAVDLDVSCEIHVNETLCGRTTVKKCIGAPVWLENYSFTDLSDLVLLEVTAWKEKKLYKPVPLGAVRVTLPNFPRGEAVEGRYPLIHQSLHVGDLLLRIKITEVIIMPHSVYGSLIKTFDSRNFLEWVRDFEGIMRIKTLSAPFIAMAVARNTILDQICECADSEVDGTSSSHNTLFRGNTVLTKVMEHTMAWYGNAWLDRSIGATLRRLCDENICIEVDPLKEYKNVKDMEKHVDLLVLWTKRFWDQIWMVRNECPPQMRRLFHHLRNLVERRYASSEEHRELHWQAISSFVFLRFMVPGLLNPHLFQLLPGSPRQGNKRSLTLIAKVIQSLANLNANVQKEEFMRGVKDFIRQRVPDMIDYLMVVSTPSENDEREPSMSSAERHDRKDIIQSIRERTVNLTALDREAIPSLPDLIDIPRQLAIVTATVMHNSARGPTQAQTGDTRLDEFCAKCLVVEERALQAVSTRSSARRLPPTNRRASFVPAASPPTSPPPRRRHLSTATPISVPTSPTTTTSTTPSLRRRKSSRPSTAPDSAAAGASQSPPSPSTGFVVHPTAPPSPSVSPTHAGGTQSLSFPESSDGEHPSSWSKRLLHMRSTSNDSIASNNGTRVPPEPSPLVSRQSQESTTSTGSSSSTIMISASPAGPEERKKRNVLRSILRMS